MSETQTQTQIGVCFPNRCINANTENILTFAPNAEEIGLNFIAVYDHVVGADPARREKESTFTNCRYTSKYSVHEPMVLLGAMAALTKKIRLVTGCLVAPQRQTALMAKQTTEIDILSRGRLDLGICVGWNKVEFEALGADFSTRGQRIEGQISLLRKLWTEGSIDYQSPTESLAAVELNPRPLQQPIPVLLGGLSKKAVERAARIGNGWIPLGRFDDEMKDRLDYYWQCARSNGTENPKVVGWVNPLDYSYDNCMKQYEGWVSNDATHIAIGTLPFQSTTQYFGEIKNFLQHLDSRR